MTANNQIAEANVKYLADVAGQAVPVGYLCTPGYKQTEVGVIPEDWELKKLKQISPSQSVGLVINPSSYFSENGSVPMLVGSHIFENSIKWENANRITTESNAQLPASRLKAGDLVTVRVGGPGVTAVIPPELDGCNCASMMIVRQGEKFNSLWLCFLMNSRIGRTQVEGVQYGTAQKQFNIIDAVDFVFPFPSIIEQTAIANVLSDVDALSKELEKLIAKKQSIKTTTMQQLLTGRTRLPQFALREDGTPKAYKQSELGEIPEDWEVFAIKDLGDIVTGGTPSTSVIEYWNGDIPWITPSDINDSKDISNGERAISSLGLKSLRELPANTVLVTCIASIGKNAVLRKIGACNQQINAVIPRKTVNTDFLFYAIEQSKERLKASAGITATPIISKALFGEFLLVAPNIREQTAIATILSDMDAEIQTLQKRLAKTHQIKQGMMQELLIGKTRLIKPKPSLSANDRKEYAHEQ